MLRGRYSRWVLSDIGDLGWRGTPRRRYITLLWGRILNSGKTKVCITSMAISTPYTGTNGKRYNETSQFQNIFRLLNSNQLIEGPLDFDKFIYATKKYLYEHDANFLVRFDLNTKKNLVVKEITYSTKSIIKNSEAFEWPTAVADQLVTEEFPDLAASASAYDSTNLTSRSQETVLDEPLDIAIEDEMDKMENG